MKLRTLLAIVPVLALGLWGVMAALDQPHYEERDLPLTGLLRTKSDVFAANPDGLFRANLASKRWVRLDIPPEMPPGGTFARQPEDSQLVFYVASRPAISRAKPIAGPLKYGLYLSSDAGTTWTRACDSDDLANAILLPNGKLFALLRPLNANFTSARAIVSTDRGKTWRDISKGLIGSILNVFPDPEHPDRVCLLTNGMRNYVAEQPGSDSYAWKNTIELYWQMRRQPTAKFFRQEYYSTSGLYPMLPATLANYFDHDFHDQIALPAFEIRLPRQTFEFRPGEPMKIPVRVAFREDLAATLAELKRASPKGKAPTSPTPTVVTLLDQPDGADFWRLKVETDREQESLQSSFIKAFGSPKEGVRDAMVARIKTPGETRSIRLDASTPYDRTIDIGQLYDFSRPGIYRVQLVYAPGTAPDQSKGEWGGQFTGTMFQVSIKK